MPVQSRNLDIVQLSAGQGLKGINSMEIESLFGSMIKQVSLIGESCRNNLTEARVRISALEDKSNIVNEALDTLVTKDQELTVTMRNQALYNEVISQTISWLRNTMEAQQQLNITDFQRINDWNKKFFDDFKLFQTSVQSSHIKSEEFRNALIKTELLDDQVKSIQSTLEMQSNSKDTFIIQMNSQNSKVKNIEAIYQRLEEKFKKMEDKILLNESRMKEVQKSLEELPKLRETSKENTRDILVLDEEIEKLKKSLRAIEDKVEKNNSKKLSKAEKTSINNIEAEVAGIQEKVHCLETIVEHLNETKFEDFGRRFKKEIFENNDSHIVKISKELAQLEERSNSQNSSNELLQKNLLTLQKKIDSEVLKIQDAKYTQAAEERWNRTESKLEELNSNLEVMLRKSKQHDQDILGLSENVYDYSFREMASSFDERVDNRLINVKQQMKDLSAQISSLNKVKCEDSNSSILISKVQKMVDNKLEAHVDMIDQKLMKLENTKPFILNAPKETETGKKILYKFKDQYIDQENVQVSVDGSYGLKKSSMKKSLGEGAKFDEKTISNEKKQNNCKYGEKCDRIFCQRDHDDDFCPDSSYCSDRWCNLRHIKPKPLANAQSQNNNRRNSFKSDRNCNEGNYLIKQTKGFSGTEPTKPKFCDLKENCPRANCPLWHRKEACGGFKLCKKVECKRRHHPSRPQFQQRQSSFGIEKANIQTYKYPQQPIYATPQSYQCFQPYLPAQTQFMFTPYTPFKMHQSSHWEPGTQGGHWPGTTGSWQWTSKY